MGQNITVVHQIHFGHYRFYFSFRFVFVFALSFSDAARKLFRFMCTIIRKYSGGIDNDDDNERSKTECVCVSCLQCTPNSLYYTGMELNFTQHETSWLSTQFLVQHTLRFVSILSRDGSGHRTWCYCDTISDTRSLSLSLSLCWKSTKSVLKQTKQIRNLNSCKWKDEFVCYVFTVINSR